jgi:hypothetical protein
VVSQRQQPLHCNLSFSFGASGIAAYLAAATIAALNISAVSTTVSVDSNCAAAPALSLSLKRERQLRFKIFNISNFVCLLATAHNNLFDCPTRLSRHRPPQACPQQPHPVSSTSLYLIVENTFSNKLRSSPSVVWE